MVENQILSVGSRVARFTITRVIGHGAMASIYRAEWDGEPRFVALKVIRSSMKHDRTAVARFLREAQACSQLQHSGAVRIFDWGVEEGVPYIAMELLTGRDLFDVLRVERKLAPTRAVLILAQLCDVLAAAHDLGIVHRDLKPENIIMNTDGPGGAERLKILDFGIAKLISTANDGSTVAQELTRIGKTVGTPSHMAPEQARGKAVDGRTDLYACGVLLYEMVTGHLPFEGGSAVDIAIRQVREPPPLPRSYLPDINPELERLILKLLEKAPDDRYQSARELQRALGEVHEVLRREEEDAAAASATGEAIRDGSTGGFIRLGYTGRHAALRGDDEEAPPPSEPTQLRMGVPLGGPQTGGGIQLGGPRPMGGMQLGGPRPMGGMQLGGPPPSGGVQLGGPPPSGGMQLGGPPPSGGVQLGGPRPTGGMQLGGVPSGGMQLGGPPPSAPDSSASGARHPGASSALPPARPVGPMIPRPDTSTPPLAVTQHSAAEHPVHRSRVETEVVFIAEDEASSDESSGAMPYAAGYGQPPGPPPIPDTAAWSTPLSALPASQALPMRAANPLVMTATEVVPTPAARMQGRAFATTPLAVDTPREVQQRQPQQPSPHYPQHPQQQAYHGYPSSPLAMTTPAGHAPLGGVGPLSQAGRALPPQPASPTMPGFAGAYPPPSGQQGPGSMPADGLPGSAMQGQNGLQPPQGYPPSPQASQLDEGIPRMDNMRYRPVIALAIVLVVIAVIVAVAMV